jgi:hypothetical protein
MNRPYVIKGPTGWGICDPARLAEEQRREAEENDGEDCDEANEAED